MIATITLNPSLDEHIVVHGLVVEETNRWVRRRRYAGGKGINVAKAAKSLGREAAATGITAGNNGRFIIEQLNKMGIRNQFLEVDGETRVNTNIFDMNKGLTTEILEKGTDISREDDIRYIEISMFL